jgi:hypothetical protein
MGMWQSQAFGGTFSFGASVPADQGTACRVCAAEALNPPAAMTVAPIALKKRRRAILSRMPVSSRGFVISPLTASR